jgi:hypothetical protein
VTAAAAAAAAEAGTAAAEAYNPPLGVLQAPYAANRTAPLCTASDVSFEWQQVAAAAQSL